MRENEWEIPKYPTGLKRRGKALWDELHTSADFTGCPETVTIIEESCFLTDEIDRLRRLIRKAGADTRVEGYAGQPVSMPEVTDLQRNQTLLLSMLKAVRTEDAGDSGKRTPSQIGRMGAEARWRPQS